MKKTLFLAFVFCGSLIAREFQPVQQVAQANSMFGGYLTNDSLYANPASSTFVRVYSVDASFHSKDDFSVSVLDTKTSRVGGGLAYFRTSVPWAVNSIQGAKLSLGSRISSGLGVAATGKMLWGTNQNGAEERIYDADVGLLANLGSLQFGGVVRNVLGGSSTLDEVPEWAAGARLGYKQLIFLNTSARARLSEGAPYEYSVGAEYVSPYRFSLKGGYRVETNTRNSFWGLGGGINSPKVSFNYGVELPNQTGDMAHTLSVNALF